MPSSVDGRAYAKKAVSRVGECSTGRTPSGYTCQRRWGGCTHQRGRGTEGGGACVVCVSVLLIDRLLCAVPAVVPFLFPPPPVQVLIDTLSITSTVRTNNNNNNIINNIISSSNSCCYSSHCCCCCHHHLHPQATSTATPLQLHPSTLLPATLLCLPHSKTLCLPFLVSQERNTRKQDKAEKTLQERPAALSSSRTPPSDRTPFSNTLRKTSLCQTRPPLSQARSNPRTRLTPSVENQPSRYNSPPSGQSNSEKASKASVQTPSTLRFLDPTLVPTHHIQP
ncbi:hypothetical protein EDD21DRAFT_74798 [Dissophora ornata]|nr:hypothetical protein EDD21DRAFT_74798 [Dissophora ornata]